MQSIVQDQQLARAVRDVEERLVEEFGTRVSRHEISDRTRASLAGFSDARIKTYIPILVQRQVREQLRVQ